jgi:DNA-binding LacI/PurR family transcriptional regulator
MLAGDICRHQTNFAQTGGLCSSVRQPDDVAHEAGVSQQTVSRVLNRPDVVSARTREKVIRAMQALHYVPNRSAQLLAGKARLQSG